MFTVYSALSLDLISLATHFLVFCVLIWQGCHLAACMCLHYIASKEEERLLLPLHFKDRCVILIQQHQYVLIDRSLLLYAKTETSLLHKKYFIRLFMLFRLAGVLVCLFFCCYIYVTLKQYWIFATFQIAFTFRMLW